jgi:hypothetical protein
VLRRRSEIDLDVHFNGDWLRSGFSLQHSRRETILLYRSNGALIKSIRKRADYADLPRRALLVDNAGHDNYAARCLSGRKFRVGSRE